MNKKLQDERELLSGPGDTILETIEFMKMSQAELAQRMGKTPSKINDLITGKEPITMTTALQLEKVLGIESMFWLTRETNYREKLARLKDEEEMEEYIDWLNKLPVTELRKSGFVKESKAGPGMVKECLSFYGVTSPAQWESLYVSQFVTASFRKSDKHQLELGSMSAWLRMGEIEMKKLKIPEYDKDQFKKSLTVIRKLVKVHPEDFAIQLQEICLAAGVAVIYTVCISKAPISGVARWLGGNPLIQLSDRYKSNAHFWFTFYHEAGHISLHGKKDVFIEDFDGFCADMSKEEEANEFAVTWLIPEDFTKNLPDKITENYIRTIAQKNQTHPAIILGRLQHLKKVSYSFGTGLNLKVTLDHITKKDQPM